MTLVALVGLFWLVVDYGSEYAAPLLPYSLQAKLGESVFEELTADKDECHGKAGLAAINGLANRLARAADYPHEITVHVIEGGPVNAFTLPGGILVFYSDLIDQAKDSSQVAGVMAHEIGHAVHFHPMKGLARQYGIDLMVKLVSGGYSDLLNTLTSGGNLLLALSNGRAFERDADATGVALLEKLGVRADGISSFFEQMMEKEPKDMAPPPASGRAIRRPPSASPRPSVRRPANPPSATPNGGRCATSASERTSSARAERLERCTRPATPPRDLLECAPVRRTAGSMERSGKSDKVPRFCASCRRCPEEQDSDFVRNAGALSP